MGVKDWSDRAMCVGRSGQRRGCGMRSAIFQSTPAAIALDGAFRPTRGVSLDGGMVGIDEL